MEIENGPLVRGVVLAVVFVAGMLGFGHSLMSDETGWFTLVVVAMLVGGVALGIALVSLRLTARDRRGSSTPAVGTVWRSYSAKVGAASAGFVLLCLLGFGLDLLTSNGLNWLGFIVCALLSGVALGSAFDPRAQADVMGGSPPEGRS